jgi:hypothetical protein
VVALINLSGKKFGSLVVVNRDGSNTSGAATWLCLCDCGKETVAVGSNLRRGTHLSCGCQGNQPIDETGNLYGRLLVLKRATTRRRNNSAMWECLCDCGEVVDIAGTSLRAGSYKSCGHLLAAEEMCANIIFSRYKQNHRRLGFSAKSLAPQGQVNSFIRDNCHYCGCPPNQLLTNRYKKEKRQMPYNGLDRLDSNQGYTKNNIVPCCGDCNHAKMDLSLDHFRQMVCDIHQNFGKHPRFGPEMKGEDFCFNAFYSKTKSRHKELGFDVSNILTKSAARRIIKQNCFYCGCEPYQVKTRKNKTRHEEMIYTGIDRANNNNGYTKSNVVPCCGKCNKAKHKMSLDEFNDFIGKIYHNWAKHRTD